ncbi:MAG: methyltransferase domain-containing protein [Verrucomicrobia bacterium]|nr:methyltransferase domain-containing protein [Verrucomicrobiota bacterium]
MTKKTSTDWEQHYQEENTPWDKGQAAPGLTAFLKKQTPQGRILVPGCGLGHDVRELSAAGGDDAEVIGLDLAPTAMARANEIIKVGREQFVTGDFFDLPDDLRGSFDWIWEHTCFCAIDPDLRKKYVQASADALKIDGKLLAVFYLDPYDEEHTPGEGPPHGCSLEELAELFRHQFNFIEHWQPDHAYPGRENKELMMILQKR